MPVYGQTPSREFTRAGVDKSISVVHVVTVGDMHGTQRVVIVAATLLFCACKTTEPAPPYFIGTIASRAPGSILVATNLSPSFACDSQLIATIASAVVDSETGRRVDTVALTVGRFVSVWIAPGAYANKLCPFTLPAGRILIHY